MKSFIILSFIFVFFLTTTPGFSKTSYWESREFAWDVNHVSLTALGIVYINHVFKMPFWKASLTMLALGFTWECLDEIYSRQTKVKFGIWDHAGFKTRDIYRNCFAVVIAFPIRRK